MFHLPENVAIALLMLQPFFIGLAAYTYELEKIGTLQILLTITAYFSIILITNPFLLDLNMRPNSQ
jgi:drug/metabolite transporter (DMT)-like permease